MGKHAGFAAKLFRGRTTVPDFSRLSWLEAGVVAVRHRVVRDLCPLAKLVPGDPLFAWVVVDQAPRAGTAVPVGAEVKLFVRPPAAASQRDLGRGQRSPAAPAWASSSA